MFGLVRPLAGVALAFLKEIDRTLADSSIKNAHDALTGSGTA